MARSKFTVSVKNAAGEKKSLVVNVPECWEKFSLALKAWPMDEAAMNEKFCAGVKVDAASVIKAVCKVNKEYDLEKFTQSAAQNAADAYVPVVSRSKRTEGEKNFTAVKQLLSDENLDASQKAMLEKMMSDMQS